MIKNKTKNIFHKALVCCVLALQSPGSFSFGVFPTLLNGSINEKGPDWFTLQIIPSQAWLFLKGGR